MTKSFVGTVFSRLTVLGVARNKSPTGATLWVCACSCGATKEFIAANVKSGHSRSCGCLKADASRAANTRHGFAGRNGKSSEYYSYHHMLKRCGDPLDPAFADYGARGITVCKEWLTSFQIFIADMGSKPSPAHTIERRNNDIGYSKQNCVWALRKQQARNKRTNLLLSFQGETRCLADWCETLNLEYTALNARVSVYGWSAERALTTPTPKPYRPYADRKKRT